MEDQSFDSFLKDHPVYCSAYEKLVAESRLLATSAQLVYELQGSRLEAVADDILAFVEDSFSADYMDRYISRVNKLAELQSRFDANPSAATLGDASYVEADDYGLALLLSIVFTNHRFEIMQALETFLRDLREHAGGVIMSLGCGTGFELKKIAQLLPTWRVEGYDIDAEMRARARRLLQFFKVRESVALGEGFALDKARAVGMYDAIILCEVLEHLQNPAQALETLSDCLKERGKMFVTMAVNIAQEDHVFLYPNVEACRRQLRESGLVTLREWLSPQTIRFPPPDRETGFVKGNYMAVVATKSAIA